MILSAVAAAQRILRNFLSGRQHDRYAYGQAPLREEVIQRFTNPQGELIAAVTQNTYGSLVLNTAQVMFIDLDFAPTRPGEAIRHFFRKLFDKSAMSPEAQREQDTRRKLEKFLSDHSQFSVRAYRTCAGMRALATACALRSNRRNHPRFAPVGRRGSFVRATVPVAGMFPRQADSQAMAMRPHEQQDSLAQRNYR